MKRKSRQEPTSHQPRPFDAYSIKYIRIQVCDSNEFPISYPWESYVEPESHSVNTMIVSRVLEIGYCHSGSGILVVEDRVIPFGAGCISVVGNQAIRMTRSHTGSPSFWSWVWIDHHRLLAGMPDDMEMLAQNPFSSPDFPYVFTPLKHRPLCQAVRRIVVELNQRAFGHRVVVKGLACAFMASLFRFCQDFRPGRKSTEHSEIDRLAPALQQMTNRYAESVDVGDLADRCNLSLTHFRRVFLAAIGKSPLQYLAQLRVRMAAAVLSDSDKPISQIAFEVGFESINTFNRQFRQTLGVSPREWRSQQRR